jgi:hypothetical protein
MKNLQIVLNPNDPSYADIEKELQAQLAALGRAELARGGKSATAAGRSACATSE